MKLYQRILFISFTAMLIAGCGLVEISTSQAGGFPANISPQSTYILSVPGATPTPTPFQPIPPTPIIPPSSFLSPTAVPTDLVPSTPVVEITVVSIPEEQTLEQLPSQINILLLGADARPWSSNFRTDTIILVTLNSELGRINVTSFPRDLWVTIPGYGMGRINTAYTFGGYSMLAKTFKHNFGVTPDYYVLINFSSFKRIVDSLGGLDVNVTQPLSDYRAGYWTSIPKGEFHMDADMVLWYVRSRKTTNDFARNRRQQEVLRAIFDKLLSLDAIRRAPEFFQIYKENVVTDVGLVDVITWLPLAAKVADSGDIHHYYVGAGNVYDWITPDGAMVLVPNQASVMQVIRKSQNLQ